MQFPNIWYKRASKKVKQKMNYFGKIGKREKLQATYAHKSTDNAREIRTKM